LGGWLIFVGIAVIFSAPMMIIDFFATYLEVFSEGYLEILITPGSEAYNPFLALILIAEILTNIGLVLTWIFIAFLFFSKKKIFPKWFIGVLLFTLVFIIVDALAVKVVFPNEPMFDTQGSVELGRLLVYISIWVPYMLVSKRVKATFIK
jgi:hypothetical protein